MKALTTVIRQAFYNLMINRSRTVLTMFGIAWGIATVILLASLVSGFHRQNMRRMEQSGLNMLVLDYGRFGTTEDGALIPLKHDLADAQFIVDNCPYVVKAVPQIESWLNMTVGDKERRFGVTASTPEIAEQMQLKLLHGRFFNAVDNDSRSKVAIVGYRVAEHFWGEGVNPVGEDIVLTVQSSSVQRSGNSVSITVSGDETMSVPFKVIGMIGRERSDPDFHVYIPLSVQESLFGEPGVQSGSLSIYATLDSINDYDKGVEMVKRLLAARHGYDVTDESAIRVRDFAEWRDMAKKIFGMFFAVFYTIGILTLAIGAVGVMNVMLVSVQERTREIGLRKAIGATFYVILTQFMAESLAIALIGGIMGMAVGLLLTGIMRMAPLPDTVPPPVVTATTIYIAVAVNIVVGLLAGTLPARQAASLDPIVALGSE
jgi:putative ABC transport system permease protein